MSQTIAANVLATKLQNGTLIDVREAVDFEQEHISGAVNIPIAQLPQRLNELNPQETYYIICYLGGRSARACEFLEGNQFENVVNVEGGMEAWRHRVNLENE
ncbi:rhodanese-like domain-containing protein [Vagococcus entomophilus]|uniref:Rhodanese domain-containing protein n=1 Tax=Vagococcus entomophilus TaxID=1160095 RepID=A0A430AL76_9ENTE|nr:rhodanese-like domain-containing protein [Vagococcus entomophilus]RSU08627.1 hypothetical protein CBF30_05215 [Vagococcus entomophilus]